MLNALFPNAKKTAAKAVPQTTKNKPVPTPPPVAVQAAQQQEEAVKKPAAKPVNQTPPVTRSSSAPGSPLPFQSERNVDDQPAPHTQASAAKKDAPPAAQAPRSPISDLPGRQPFQGNNTRTGGDQDRAAEKNETVHFQASEQRPSEKPPAERTYRNGHHTRMHRNGPNGFGKNGVSKPSPLFPTRPVEEYSPVPSPVKADFPVQEPIILPERPVNGHQLPHKPAEENRPSKPGPASNGASQGKDVFLPALNKILEEQAELPSQAAVLGVGEDGFPVLLDLEDPSPGALLAVGDERQEQINLLRSALASVVARNTPRSVQVFIITCDEKMWNDWISAQGYDRFMLGIEGVDDINVLREWILRLGDWTEQRRLEQAQGPAVLLIMDTLSFLTRLDYDIRLNFEWMAKEGPPAQIWPLAAISTDLAQALNGRHMLRAFRTRILGLADEPDFYVQFAGVSQQGADDFGQPGMYAVKVGEDWLRFHLPR